MNERSAPRKPYDAVERFPSEELCPNPYNGNNWKSAQKMFGKVQNTAQPIDSFAGSWKRQLNMVWIC